MVDIRKNDQLSPRDDNSILHEPGPSTAGYRIYKSQSAGAPEILQPNSGPRSGLGLRLTNGCALECGVGFRQMRTCRRTRSGPPHAEVLYLTSKTFVLRLRSVPDDVYIKTRAGQMPEILDHCSGERRPRPAPNWRRWNKGSVIHATEPSADHRHNLGAGKIQVLALSNIARRTPAVVREAIHDAVVCAGKHL